MCYSRLHILSALIEDEKICRLENFLSECSSKPAIVITASRVANVIDVSPQLAIKVLQELVKNDYLGVSYALRCPECGTLIKRYRELSEVETQGNRCYKCEEEFDITPENIEILYTVKDDCFFKNGQHEKEGYYSVSAAQENTLEFLIKSGGINDLLFHPNVSEYNRLQKLYDEVFTPKQTTKGKGDALEQLTIYLFGLCKAFGANGIRTSSNQIDCFVSNGLFCNFGVFGQIGPRIIIECKNEERTPKVDYIEKLESIISIANAGIQANFVRLGIIVSRAKPPRTYKRLANMCYLSSKIIIIVLCKDDLLELVKGKKNLLEMIERKITEIIMPTSTDLVERNIYGS